MKKGLLHILCLMAILAFHSCSHERFDGDKRNLDFSVDEARAYFENNATDLRYNELVYSSTPTKADDNIVIVGYYPDGTLIYMDPESSSLKECEKNIIKGNYVYVITGNKY